MSYQTTLRPVTKDPKEQETTTLQGETWTVLEEDGAFNVTLPLGFGKYLLSNSSSKSLQALNFNCVFYFWDEFV